MTWLWYTLVDSNKYQRGCFGHLISVNNDYVIIQRNWLWLQCSYQVHDFRKLTETSNSTTWRLHEVDTTKVCKCTDDENNEQYLTEVCQSLNHVAILCCRVNNVDDTADAKRNGHGHRTRDQ